VESGRDEHAHKNTKFRLTKIKHEFGHKQFHSWISFCKCVIHRERNINACGGSTACDGFEIAIGDDNGEECVRLARVMRMWRVGGLNMPPRSISSD
jgi:hypothetical protein